MATPQQQRSAAQKLVASRALRPASFSRQPSGVARRPTPRPADAAATAMRLRALAAARRRAAARGGGGGGGADCAAASFSDQRTPSVVSCRAGSSRPGSLGSVFEVLALSCSALSAAALDAAAAQGAAAKRAAAAGAAAGSAPSPAAAAAAGRARGRAAAALSRLLRALGACLLPAADAAGCVAAATAHMCIAVPVLPPSPFTPAALMP
ncbi:hypothetical protein Rsub_08779 [Raphidocelis subcapitata]|uniref:Uncharacterized protein n=1 Tax=Raphidocelis subcapitata TaxID=307507 RepID=A0A2V0P8P4_9CHLO|nr:hypothetical protein Rsub_08779 [Raphidocelis subcapitata]|eukprot:GBF96234.1 hypothetical protein Rsub_08779 [Raphidocelis subcapitata]